MRRVQLLALGSFFTPYRSLPGELCRHLLYGTNRGRATRELRALSSLLTFDRELRFVSMNGTISSIVGSAVYVAAGPAASGDHEWPVRALEVLHLATEQFADTHRAVLHDLVVCLFSDRTGETPFRTQKAKRRRSTAAGDSTANDDGEGENCEYTRQHVTSLVQFCIDNGVGLVEVVAETLRHAKLFCDAQMRAAHASLAFHQLHDFRAAFVGCYEAVAMIDALDPGLFKFNAEQAAFGATRAANVLRYLLSTFADVKTKVEDRIAVFTLFSEHAAAVDDRLPLPSSSSSSATAVGDDSVIEVLRQQQRSKGARKKEPVRMPVDTLFCAPVRRVIKTIVSLCKRGEVLEFPSEKDDTTRIRQLNSYAFVNAMALHSTVMEAAFKNCAGNSRRDFARLLDNASKVPLSPLHKIIDNLSGLLADLERERLHIPLARNTEQAAIQAAHKHIFRVMPMLFEASSLGKFDDECAKWQATFGIALSLRPLWPTFVRNEKEWSEVSPRRLRSIKSALVKIDWTAASLPSFVFADAIALFVSMARSGEENAMRYASNVAQAWHRTHGVRDHRAPFWVAVLGLVRVLDGATDVGPSSVGQLLRESIRLHSKPNDVLLARKLIILTDARKGLARIALLDEKLKIAVDDAFVARLKSGDDVQPGWVLATIYRGACSDAVKANPGVVGLTFRDDDAGLRANWHVIVEIGATKYAINIARRYAERVGGTDMHGVTALVVIGFRYSSGAYVETAVEQSTTGLRLLAPPAPAAPAPKVAPAPKKAARKK
jgi:hypothetical protein